MEPPAMSNRRSFADRMGRMQVAWRFAGFPVRLAVLVAAGVVVCAAVVAIVSSSQRVDATTASILVAVFFGVTAVVQQRQTQRRQHTVDLITAFQTADALSAADAWMADRITRRATVGGDVLGADQGHVMTLLDYYEFLAVLARRGLVDVPLLLDLRGGAMTRAFDICRPYVHDRRSNVWPGLYSCLEMFADVYAQRNQGHGARTKAPSAKPNSAGAASPPAGPTTTV
jgi:hypothetical protein